MHAQAKVNLRLKILAREAGGFHQIETLFLRLDLADRVRVRRMSGSRSLDVSGDVDLSLIGPPEHNLAWLAAEAYLSATGDSGGFAIEIEKHIPIGGGLGGGSADAGAVLRALDASASAPLGDAALLSLAARLGSDVPFLTTTHPYVLAWGRGERMLAVEPPERRAVLLVLPGMAVNTAAAYQWLAADRTASGATAGLEPLLTDMHGLSDWATLATLAENDFETVVAQHHEVIGNLVASLRGAPPFALAMMSGSGSTVFAVERTSATALSMVSTTRADGSSLGRHVHTFTATRVEPVSMID